MKIRFISATGCIAEAVQSFASQRPQREVTVRLADPQSCATDICFIKSIKGIAAADKTVNNIELGHDRIEDLSPLIKWFWDLSDSAREDMHSWLYARSKNISASIRLKTLMGTDPVLASRALCERLRNVGFDSININIDEHSFESISRYSFNWILLFVPNCNIYFHDIRFTLPPVFLSPQTIIGNLFLPVFRSLHPHVSKVFLKYFDQSESGYTSFKEIFLRSDTGWDAIVNRCFPWFKGEKRFVLQKSLTPEDQLVIEDQDLLAMLCEANRNLGYPGDISILGVNEATQDLYSAYVKALSQPCAAPSN